MAVHRLDCVNFRQMSGKAPERVIPVAWGRHAMTESAHYAVDVLIEAHDRSGLLRDVCDVLAQGKSHVVSMNSQAVRDKVTITLTVQTSDSAKLQSLLAKVLQINGVLRARRK